MRHELRFDSPRRSCTIHVMDGGILHAEGLMGELPPDRPLALLTDRTVGDCQRGFLESLQGLRPHVAITVQSGESSKSWSELGLVLEAFASHGLTRETVVLCFGGGVVGDLGGLAAALYMRGIDVIQVPTSLLSQVDAAIGGKTAVNLVLGKNLAGVFHQPRSVWIDVSFLATLPESEFVNGCAEIVKTWMLLPETEWDALESRLTELAGRQPAVVLDVVKRCVAFKAAVVGDDPFDHGVRAILNLGHTVGHALERAGPPGGRALRHGEAVALGLRAECAMACHRGRMTPERVARLNAVLDRLGLPGRAPTVAVDDVLRAMRHDKKRRHVSEFSTVLPLPGGSAALVHDVSEAEMRQGLRAIGLDS